MTQCFRNATVLLISIFIWSQWSITFLAVRGQRYEFSVHQGIDIEATILGWNLNSKHTRQGIEPMIHDLGGLEPIVF